MTNNIFKILDKFKEINTRKKKKERERERRNKKKSCSVSYGM